jgi:hypothetical protein
VRLPPDGQDRVSLLLQLSLLARARPGRIVEGVSLTLPLATLHDVEQATWHVGAARTLEAAGRQFRVLPIQRPGTGAGALGIELWLADDALRTPALIRFDDDGRSLRFVLADPPGQGLSLQRDPGTDDP